LFKSQEETEYGQTQQKFSYFIITRAMMQISCET